MWFSRHIELNMARKLLSVLLLLCVGAGACAGMPVSKLAPDLRTMGRAAKRDFVVQQINAHRSQGCLVFSKTYWPYATNGKNALAAAGASFTLIELDECGEPRNGEVQQV